jgi:hypothetical protein
MPVYKHCVKHALQVNARIIEGIERRDVLYARACLFAACRCGGPWTPWISLGSKTDLYRCILLGIGLLIGGMNVTV